MNQALLAGLVAGLLLAAGQAGPSAGTAPAASGERLEAGELRAQDGSLLEYRIRLLPVSSFPEMPAGVAEQLTNRHCMIPQSFEAQEPENVIAGSFRAAGSADWAALCSAAGMTTLYVFFGGQFGSPVALRSQTDTTWLGAEPGSRIFGSGWGIATRGKAELRDAPELRRSADFDHDAVEDSDLEHSVRLHYYQAGTWMTLIPGS